MLQSGCAKADESVTALRIEARGEERAVTAKITVTSEPSRISPLDLYIELVKVSLGETSLGERLSVTRALVDRFIVDLQAYEKTRTSSQATADALREDLRKKLVGGCARWQGLVDGEILREALYRLDQCKS